MAGCATARDNEPVRTVQRKWARSRGRTQGRLQFDWTGQAAYLTAILSPALPQLLITYLHCCIRRIE